MTKDLQNLPKRFSNTCFEEEKAILCFDNQPQQVTLWDNKRVKAAIGMIGIIHLFHRTKSAGGVSAQHRKIQLFEGREPSVLQRQQ